MLRTVHAIESLARLPAYRDAVLSRSTWIARRDFGPRGAFMGYDFHLAHDGPRLIEINTNAGGAFLNALLARAQHACCEEILSGLRRSEARDFDAAVARMFDAAALLQAHADLRNAARTGKDIDRLSTAVGALIAKMQAIHTTAFAQLYNILTPTQRDQLDKYEGGGLYAWGSAADLEWG